MHIEKKILETSGAPQGNDYLGQWLGADLPSAIHVFDNTSSVLDCAWHLVHNNKLPLWGSALAQSQECGRGQTRRLWHSPKGNMYAALRLPAEGIFCTSAAAVAFSAIIIKAFAKLGLFLQLKWPNDLVFSRNEHKIGGILLEERHGVLLAGIGINISYAPENALLREKYALEAGKISVPQQLKQGLTRKNKESFFYAEEAAECLWLHLVKQIYICYKGTLSPQNSWKNHAEDFLLWKNQAVELHDDTQCICGILHGLGALGELELLINGKAEHFVSGSLRRAIA